MRSLADLIAFCKAQATYHLTLSAESRLKPHQTKKHREVGEQLNEVVAYLERSANTPPPSTTSDAGDLTGDLFALDPFHLNDVPDELKDELKISKASKAEAQILELFRIAGRPLTISEVLVGIYRKFGEQEKRTSLSARLYRLAQEKILESVGTERGTYQLPGAKAPPAQPSATVTTLIYPGGRTKKL